MNTNEYYILSTSQIGDLCFVEDGVSYYVMWFGHHLPAARHALSILGKRAEFYNFTARD